MKPVTRPCGIKARIKPEIHKALKELSELTGETMSTTVNDLLEAALPGLNQTIRYMREAQKMDEKSKQALADAFKVKADALEAKITETMQEADDDIKQFKLPL